MGDRPKGMTLDRKDNDKEYSKANCRWATQQQQVANTRPRKNTSSNYKGVSLQKTTGNWIGTIRAKGKVKHLGSFKEESKAALAYNKAALEAWGSDAYINDI